MIYDRETGFLLGVLDRCGVESRICPRGEVAELIRGEAERFLPSLDKNELFAPIREMAAKTMYRLCDPLGRRFICLPTSPEEAMLIGPYLSAALGEAELLEIGEQLGISPKNQRYLNEYMLALPVIAEGDSLLRMINAYCELIWQTKAFSIRDSIGAEPSYPLTLSDRMTEGGVDDVALGMRAIEKRYEYENRLMRAVELGQLHVLSRLLAGVGESMFEKRVADPIRNAKNYGIIMNTLLRKAAERGGVHPFYLDRASSEIAAKIESLSELSENRELMMDIFRSYCLLVRSHSTSGLSPVVEKAVLTIDADPSANLTLSTLADSQGVSHGYLSTIFRREVGVTVSEYIRERRMKHAMHLLSTTTLQVQTVALHCGILDVQYFSKLFKRHTGMTPKEYRESAPK